MAVTFNIDTSMANLQEKSVLVRETDTDYIVLNYNSSSGVQDSSSVQDDSIYRLMNAIVLNNHNREILAIGPSTPFSLENFKKMHGGYNRKNIEVTEMIEGLFFQLFWDERINKWEIGTHNGVSGNYSYYRMPHVKTPTYRTMIKQAMGDVEDIQDWKGLEYMDKKCCYHFVLQHPDNHLIFKIVKPVIYIIGAFELLQTTNQIRYIPPNEYTNVFPADQELVLLPPVLTFGDDNDYESVLEEFVSIHQPNTRMGIVIKHVNTGDTVIALNPAYEELQKIRGTHPNLLYHYLCLKRIKKTEVFLNFFPQYEECFVLFHSLYESLVSQIHQSYVDLFVLKKKSANYTKFYYHIKQIHSTIYIPSLKGEHVVIIRKKIVRSYVDGLLPGQILHMLQYELYKMQEVNHK